MKEYPHIEYDGIYGEKIYAFNKLDGSNIRVEWDRKSIKKGHPTGFVKFGTRTQIIDGTDNNFGESVDMFLNKYCEDINKIFSKEKYFRNIDKVTMFSEYFGENSFAGFHEDEPKDIVLFDICPYKKGMLHPKLFVDMFGYLDIPEIIHIGNYNKEFVERIRSSDLKEGVVCKGVRKTKGNDIVWMAKIKTIKWLDRLKNKYGEERLKEEFK